MKPLSTVTLISAIVLALSIWALRSSKWMNPSSEKLSLSFTSYVSSVRGLQRIQLAEVNAVEILERTSEASVFWDFIKMPDVVVQARIPVKYTYYVEVNDAFDIGRNGNTLVVRAPYLRSGNPAADISGISYEVKKGSLFRSTRTAFDELRAKVTPLLQQSAERNKALIIEHAREQLASMIRAWMIQSPELKNQIETVQVTFDGDLP